MNDPYGHLRDRKAERVLTNEATLVALCEVPPQAFVLPHREKPKTFVIVWLYFRPEAVSLEEIWLACFTTARALSRAGVLANHVGVEIVVATLDTQGQTRDRIARIAIETAVAGTLPDLNAKRVETTNGFEELEGVECTWYQHVGGNRQQ